MLNQNVKLILQLPIYSHAENEYIQEMSFLFFIYIHFSTFALQPGLVEFDSRCACRTDMTDVLERPIRFNFGKFKDRCVDSCRYRPAKILSSTNSKEIHVGNILHYGSFYSAQIPLEDISRLEVGFEEFSFGIYHVFLQFHLREKAKSILLVNQADPKRPPISARSFVLSAEGVPPQKQAYKLIESYFGQYLIMTRVTTAEEMQRVIAEKNHKLKIYSLKLEPEFAARIFQRGLNESNSVGAESIYQLFSNNCSTSALRYIDVELGFAGAPTGWAQIEDALPIWGPFGTLRTLMNRKLIAPKDLDIN